METQCSCESSVFENDIVCDFFSTELTILSDGNVTTCCVDNKAKNVFANIYQHSLKEVMHKHLQFKKEFICSPDKHEGCALCLETASNRYYMHKATNCDQLNDFVSREFLPTQIVLEVSSRCNVQCKDCIQKTLGNDLSSIRTGKGGADLDLDYVEKWLEPLREKLRSIRAYNYGEPFLNKQLEGFSKRMTTRIPNIQIGVSTNGTVFRNEERFDSILESGLFHIVISVHGGTAETARKYMGESYPFDHVVQGLDRFLKKKRAAAQRLPIIDLKCVLFKWNDNDEELASFENLSKLLGVDIFHFMPTGGESGTKRFSPGSEAWNEFLKSGRAVQGDKEYIAQIHPYAPV